MEVIGAMMNNEEYLDEVMTIADESFFYYDIPNKAFKIIVELSRTAQPNVEAVLKRINEPKEKTWIRQADETYSGVEAFKLSLKDLTDTYMKRQYYYMASKALFLTQEQTATALDIANVVEKGIGTINFEDSKEDIISPEEYATEGLQKFRERFNNPETAFGMKLSVDLNNGTYTGFPGLDETFMGLRGGDLILIAAKTGHGKTAFAQNLSRILSVHQKYATYYQNTEMSIDEMRVRLVSQLTQVPATEILTGKISGNKDEVTQRVKKIENGYNLLFKSNLYLSRIPNLSPHKSRGLANRFRLKYKNLDCLIIDYIGRMEIDRSNGMSEWQVLYEIAKQCKTLAVQLNIPVILLSQLNDEEKIEGARKIKNECDGVLLFKKIEEKDSELLKDIPEFKREKINYKIVKEKVRRNDNTLPIWCEFDKKVQYITEVR